MRRSIDVPLWSVAVLILIMSIVAGALAIGIISARREAREARNELEGHREISEKTLHLLSDCLTPPDSPHPHKHGNEPTCYDNTIKRTADAVEEVNRKQREAIDELVCYIAQTHRTLPLEGIQCTRKESG